MLLNHQIPVDLSADEAFELFNDLDLVARCLPGAVMTATDGEEHHGTMKVKVGPITADYSGKAVFVDRDAAGRRAVIAANGSDSKGQGTAAATITVVVSGEGAGHSVVNIETDLALTGKVAQFGRGVINDVSDKLLDVFSENLRAALERGNVRELRSEAADAAGSTTQEAPLDMGNLVLSSLLPRLRWAGAGLAVAALAFLAGRRSGRARTRG